MIYTHRTPDAEPRTVVRQVLVILYSDFDIVSDFDIRISDFLFSDP